VAAIRQPPNQAFQINSKFTQIQPNQPKLRPNFSKEKAWISLDSLRRNERFQPVTPTPWAFFHPPAAFATAVAGNVSIGLAVDEMGSTGFDFSEAIV